MRLEIKVLTCIRIVYKTVIVVTREYDIIPTYAMHNLHAHFINVYILYICAE